MVDSFARLGTGAELGVGAGLRRLVDIGNKALSPAINDPYTGIQAVHHLSVLLCMLAGRRLGDRLHHDAQGTLRLAVPLPQFADYLRLGTAQIRRSGAKEPALETGGHATGRARAGLRSCVERLDHQRWWSGGSWSAAWVGSHSWIGLPSGSAVAANRPLG